MQKFRAADISLVYKIREIMQTTLGFDSGQYTVLDGYPDSLDEITVFPAVTVQSSVGGALPVQLSSRSALNVTWEIDVFAHRDGQRDDIAYAIWDTLSDVSITYYNFDSGGFPTTVGVYTGIATYGTITFSPGTMIILTPEEFTNIEAEKHHALIVITGYLSVD
jgi:hypothetical protein